MNSKSFLLNWKSFSLARSDLLLLLLLLLVSPASRTSGAPGRGIAAHNCGKHLQIQMARRGLQSEEIMYNGQNIQIRTRIPMWIWGAHRRTYIHTCIILRVACPTRCHHPLSLHHGSTILCVHCASAPKMQQMPHKCPSPMCTIDSSGGWGGASGKWALGGGWLH